MGFNMPKSMDECLYFTRRKLDNDGKIVAWVEKKDCPECGKAKMGKPVEKGKVKVRAKIYKCPECEHQEDKQEHEESCDVKVIYTCPSCGHSGETTTPYKRKKFKGADSFVFKCDSCEEKIGITKKMKGL